MFASRVIHWIPEVAEPQSSYSRSGKGLGDEGSPDPPMAAVANEFVSCSALGPAYDGTTICLPTGLVVGPPAPSIPTEVHLIPNQKSLRLGYLCLVPSTSVPYGFA